MLVCRVLLYYIELSTNLSHGLRIRLLLNLQLFAWSRHGLSSFFLFVASEFGCSFADESWAFEAAAYFLVGQSLFQWFPPQYVHVECGSVFLKLLLLCLLTRLSFFSAFKTNDRGIVCNLHRGIWPGIMVPQLAWHRDSWTISCTSIIHVSQTLVLPVKCLSP